MEGLNVPEPEEVHIPPIALLTVPLIFTDEMSLHVVMSLIVLTIGIVEKVIESVSLMESHPPIDVKNKSTVPEDISAREKVYDELSVVEFENDPEPLVLQNPLVACVTVPLRVIEVSSLQIV